MFDAFKKWSMSGHTFTYVKLTEAEVTSLGAATRQFLEEEGNGDEAAMVREVGTGGEARKYETHATLETFVQGTHGCTTLLCAANGVF